jgi:hypothetical protein
MDDPCLSGISFANPLLVMLLSANVNLCQHRMALLQFLRAAAAAACGVVVGCTQACIFLWSPTMCTWTASAA